MSEGRKPLLLRLKETVEFFKERKTVGRMKTEHSIFIPTTLMIDQSKETEDFIRAAKTINKRDEWTCPVSAEKVAVGQIAGVEFIFSFTPDTDFDSIIEFTDSLLKKEEE